MRTNVKYFLAGIAVTTLATSIITGTNIIPSAVANLDKKRCVWSYIKDTGKPELGEAGNVYMDDEWKRMTEGGWALITNKEDYWVFERCM